MIKQNRNTIMKRQWRLLDALATPKTLSDLSQQFQCSIKTIRRDLYAMREVGLPISQSGTKWCKGDNMQSPTNCTVCGRTIKNGTGMAQHMKYAHPSTKKNGNGNGHAEPSEYSVMEIVCDGVALKGAEINGKFFVITDTGHVCEYGSIRQALDAKRIEKPLVVN